MRAHFINKQSYNILLLCCLVSRLATSIYYIEDIDSLRFAYSIVDEYNLLKLQPHFPGYAVFCFIANIMYYLIGNLGLSLSIIGGISTFFIIYYVLKLLEFDFYSKEGFFTTALIFFNPMIWLMGNRYMPDLLGLSVFIASFYYLCSKKKLDILFGMLLFGLLLGIRLSYAPLFIIPILIVFIKCNNLILKSLSMLLVGVLIWLIPMVLITGIEELYFLALKHFQGHFMEYGGTVLTESDWNTRIKYLFHTIWSDGLGGYWINRSYITLIFSFLLVPLILQMINNIKLIFLNNGKIKIIIISTILYLIWILFFQNIIYKSRHVMPVVLVLIIILPIIYKNHFFPQKNNFKITYSILLITILSYITINLSIQHKNPTAISKVSQYLIKQVDPIIVISDPLINYYLRSQNINAEYIDVTHDIDSINLNSHQMNTNIFIIGDFKEKVNGITNLSDTLFYHNPYTNRMWATISLYSNVSL